jgi:pyridoxamine 5'-phosphate oxidase family protein
LAKALASRRVAVFDRQRHDRQRTETLAVVVFSGRAARRTSLRDNDQMPLDLSPVEHAYLDSQRLGRLATVAPDGQPQNNPVGFFLDDDLGVIDIGGAAMGTTKKFRNVQGNPLVSLVVDDLASIRPWRVRGVEIRGWAETVDGWKGPYAGYSQQAIRIHPHRVISWGLGEDEPTE